MADDLCLRQNEGKVDRVIRISLGAALVLLPAMLTESVWTVALLGALGGSTIMEGITGY